MEWIIIHMENNKIKEMALENKKILQDYVDTGRGGAFVALFRTRFNCEIPGDNREKREFVKSIVRGFDVWTKHEKLGLF